MQSETCALCHRKIVCGRIGPFEIDGQVKYCHVGCALYSTNVWLNIRSIDVSKVTSEEDKRQLCSLLFEPSFETAYSEALLVLITPAIVNLDSVLSVGDKDSKCKKCRKSSASISIPCIYSPLLMLCL